MIEFNQYMLIAWTSYIRISQRFEAEGEASRTGHTFTAIFVGIGLFYGSGYTPDSATTALPDGTSKGTPDV